MNTPDDLPVDAPETPAETPSALRTRDLIERVVWTAIAAALTALIGAPILDVEEWRAAALAGGTSAITAILVIARWRLSILPDPGAGLPKVG